VKEEYTKLSNKRLMLAHAQMKTQAFSRRNTGTHQSSHSRYFLHGGKLQGGQRGQLVKLYSNRRKRHSQNTGTIGRRTLRTPEPLVGVDMP
jgi:hypothetical protein